MAHSTETNTTQGAPEPVTRSASVRAVPSRDGRVFSVTMYLSSRRGEAEVARVAVLPPVFVWGVTFFGETMG